MHPFWEKPKTRLNIGMAARFLYKNTSVNFPLNPALPFCVHPAVLIVFAECASTMSAISEWPACSFKPESPLPAP